MSQDQRRDDSGAGCAALVLFLFFGLVLAMLTNSAPMNAQTVAKVETATIAPPTITNTLVPTLTNTIMPTSAPTATNTQMPAATTTSAPTISSNVISSPTAAAVAQAGNAGGSIAYDPAIVAQGQELFVTCSACHGPDARGLPRLGKDLITSEFVGGLNDQDLLNFVKTGRPSFDPANTTFVDMPPKGGNPSFTDDQLLSIIAYIRTLRVNNAPTINSNVVPSPAPVEVAQSGNAGGSANYDPAIIAQGQELFVTCSACHGPDARGLPRLGKDLITSEFVGGLNDQDLLNFVKTGRPSFDPANTTFVDMPPKGGNPSFTDDQLLSIIAYIRTLRANNGTK